jgi:hypothetical protein
MFNLTAPERLLLVGGRYTFRPDGTTRAAYAAFNQDVVTSGRRYASVAVEMTEIGKRVLRVSS